MLKEDIGAAIDCGFEVEAIATAGTAPTSCLRRYWLDWDVEYIQQRFVTDKIRATKKDAL